MVDRLKGRPSSSPAPPIISARKRPGSLSPKAHASSSATSTPTRATRRWRNWDRPRIAVPHLKRTGKGAIVNLPPGKPDTFTTPSAVWSKWPGAVSGKPFSPLADLCIGETYRRMDRGRYQIIGSGGVFTAEDACRKLRLGASFVQILTALIYEGPGVVARITSGLSRLLYHDGLRSVHDAVGLDIR